MYHYVLVGSYLAWRYGEYLQTGYNILAYCYTIRRFLATKPRLDPTDLEDDWVLCEHDGEKLHNLLVS